MRVYFELARHRLTELTIVNVVLTLTKSFTDPTVTAGGAASSFTLVITNAGVSDADNVLVTDSVDPALSVTGASSADAGVDCTATAGNSVSCSLAHLAGSGGSITITVTFTVASTVNSQTVHNTAAVHSDEDDATSNDATVDVVEDVQLSIVKSFTDPTVTAGGAASSFTLVVTNDGLSDADNLVVSDTVERGPDGHRCDLGGASCGNVGNLVTCTTAHLAGSGGSITITVTFTVASTVDSQTVHNTATADSDEVDPTPSNDATVNVVEVTNLTATKTDGKTQVVAGTDGTYTISLTNAGPSSADDVVLDDTIPSPFVAGTPTSNLPSNCSGSSGNVIDCELDASLAAGATWTITVAYTVPASATPTSVHNTATFTTEEHPGGTTASDDTAVVRHADLGITKTASQSIVFSGDEITYTITVTNHGPSFSSGFTVTDTLSGNVSFVSASAGCSHSGAAFGGTVTCVHTPDVAVGGTVTFTIVVDTKFPLAAGTTIVNTAMVDGDDTDPNPANDNASASSTVVLRSAPGSSQMTNSAFQLVDDLSPWAVPDFEILLNGQNIVAATNPGQFYYHQRATSPYSIPTNWTFQFNWPCQFESQVNGGQPMHAYVQLATDGPNTWRPWGESNNVTNVAFPSGCAQPAGTPYGQGTITVNNVPAGAKVWVNIHLDYAPKGDNISTVNPNPMNKPVVYGPFSSTITVKNTTGATIGTSFSSTSVIGRGKKVTMVYGTLTNKVTGLPVSDTWVRITQGTNAATALTGADGFYILYDGQACTLADGIAGGCTGGSTTVWNFQNGSNASTTIAILGDGVAPTATATHPTGYSSAEVRTGANSWTVKNPPTYTAGVAKGTAYLRDWRFTP